MGFAAAAETFNTAGQGFYYTFRYGDVVFVSLGLPRATCPLGDGSEWWEHWGEAQLADLDTYLIALEEEIFDDLKPFLPNRAVK